MSEEETEFVTRYIVQAPSGRFIMFQDDDDLDEWENVLEVQIPVTMAAMFDSIQIAWYGFQEYCDKITTSARELIEEEVNAMSGDQLAIDEEFSNIIQTLDESGGESE